MPEFSDPKSIYLVPPEVDYFPYDEAMADGWLKYYYSTDNGNTWVTRMIRQLRSNQEFDGYSGFGEQTQKLFIFHSESSLLQIL